MIKKIRFLIVGIVMLLAIVLLISKPRESEAESLLSYAKAIVEGEEIETKQYSEIKIISPVFRKKAVSMIFWQV